MNFIDTYLLLQQMSAVNRPGALQQSYGRPGNADTAAELSFRSILQNMQAGRTADAKNTAPAKSISAGTAMDALFAEAARKYHVDINLLKAIGKAESDFNASAVSSAGAVGVMQLMPGTARSLGVSNPYDARQNIMGGAKYISQLLDKYDGNVKLALAAYNAGPGNVDKYGGIPPFRETQNYVERVMRYAGEPISTGKTISAKSDAPQASLEPGSAVNAANNTISIKTETLLELLNFMRMQSELRFSSMMNDTQNTGNSLF